MLLSNAYNPDDRVRNEALALDASKYEVIILAWDRSLGKPLQEVADGISIRRTRLRSGYGQGLGKFADYLRLWWLFFLQVTRLKPQVIHCHDFDTFFVGLGYRVLHRKVKFVFDAHENYYVMMKPLVPAWVAGFIAFLERKFTRYADLVIGACEATANHYRKMSARQVIVVGNWKDPGKYAFPPAQVDQKRTEVGADGHLVVTYIGSLTEDRNVLPLLHAVRERPWTFAIIGGTGGQAAEIREACALLPNAYYPGYIHPDEVPLFTSLSDVIYYGIDATDSYAPYNAPNKLFEALAAGKSIVASDLGGEMSRIVRTESCGILVESVNAVTVGQAIDALQDPALRAALETNARQAGQRAYNWEIASQNLRDGYHRLWAG